MELPKAYTLIITLLSLAFGAIYISLISGILILFLSGLIPLAIAFIFDQTWMSIIIIIAALGMLFVLYVAYAKMREAYDSFLKKHKKSELYSFIYWFLWLIPILFYAINANELSPEYDNYSTLLLIIIAIAFNLIYELRKKKVKDKIILNT